MAQQIQSPTIGSRLQRLLGLQGRVRPYLEESIIPTINVGDVAYPDREWSQIASGYDVHANTAVGAFSYVQLVNPKLSNRLLLLEEYGILNDLAAAEPVQCFAELFPGSAPDSTYWRDFRLGLDPATALMNEGERGAVVGQVLHVMLAPAGTITYAKVQAVITPGMAWTVQGATTDQDLGVIFLFREIPLE